MNMAARTTPDGSASWSYISKGPSFLGPLEVMGSQAGAGARTRDPRAPGSIPGLSTTFLLKAGNPVTRKDNEGCPGSTPPWETGMVPTNQNVGENPLIVNDFRLLPGFPRLCQGRAGRWRSPKFLTVWRNTQAV